MHFKNIIQNRKFGILLLIATILIPCTAQAGVNQWTSIGPFGGNVFSLAIDPQTPSTLYAGTQSGVFKNTNSGGNWIAINSGLTYFLSIYSLAVDPLTPSTLYAGTWSGTVRPALSGYTFSPTRRTYSNVTSNKTG